MNTWTFFAREGQVDRMIEDGRVGFVVVDADEVVEGCAAEVLRWADVSESDTSPKQPQEIDSAPKRGHWTHRMPERLARGARNGKYTKPEKTPRGEAHGSAKLNKQNVVEIRDIYQARLFTQRQLADLFDVSESLVAAIVHRKLWRHVA
jgi:hypothetical protein